MSQPSGMFPALNDRVKKTLKPALTPRMPKPMRIPTPKPKKGR